MKNLATLREWAASRHGDQRYGEHPYSFHLDAVDAVADEFFPGDEQLKEGCPGHDLLEDTDTTAEDLLAAGFSPEAVKDIEAVTDVPGKDRAERKKLTLPKIRERGVSAIKLKLCDRVANVRYSRESSNEKKLAMYRHEQEQFEAALYDEQHVELQAIWQHLRELLAS